MYLESTSYGKIRGMKNVSSEELWSLYQREKSIFKVADLVGCCGETVRQKLMKAGYDVSRKLWTDAELQLLKDWYAEHAFSKNFNLDELAEKLSRDKSNVSRKARELGLTDIRREKQEIKKPTRKYPTNEESRKAISEGQKRLIQEHGHPRRFKGHKHKPEALKKISEHHKMLWRDPNSKHNSEESKQRRSDEMMKRNAENKFSNPYSRAKHGRREDLNNRYFRSSWEANYARYLNFLVEQKQIKEWDYECQSFWFEAIKRGVRSYKPDFKVVLNDGSHEWHEVKGWMNTKSKTSIARFRKYYPEEKLIVIDNDWFKQAKRAGLDGVIKNWE
jgi:hypothetical protein